MIQHAIQRAIQHAIRRLAGGWLAVNSQYSRLRLARVTSHRHGRAPGHLCFDGGTRVARTGPYRIHTFRHRSPPVRALGITAPRRQLSARSNRPRSSKPARIQHGEGRGPRRATEQQEFWRFAQGSVPVPREAYQCLLRGPSWPSAFSVLNPCWLAMQRTPRPHHQNVRTAPHRDVCTR